MYVSSSTQRSYVPCSPLLAVVCGWPDGRTDGRAESHRINTRRIHTTTTTITAIIHRYTLNQRQMDGTTNN